MRHLGRPYYFLSLNNLETLLAGRLQKGTAIFSF
jgi:hypothetical protein